MHCTAVHASLAHTVLASPFQDLRHVQGFEMEQHLAAALQEGSAWAADTRAGLGLVLRSHSAWQQRHAALQLAEAVAALAGTSWLLDAQTVQYCSAGPASVCRADVSLQEHDCESVGLASCLMGCTRAHQQRPCSLESFDIC